MPRRLLLCALVACLALPAVALGAAKTGYYAGSGGELRVSGGKVVLFAVTCPGDPKGPAPSGTAVMLKRHLSVSPAGRFSFKGPVKVHLIGQFADPTDVTLKAVISGTLTSKRATVTISDAADAKPLCAGTAVKLRYYGTKEPQG